MKKLFIWPFFLLLLVNVLSYGQTMTTVTATITDPLSQPFANGTVQATYQRPANAQGIKPLSAGVPIVEQGVANNTNLDGSGVFTLSLADLSTVTPPGGTWRFNVCANATTPCAQLTSQSVIGGSIDLSASLSAQVSTIIVNAQPTLSRAYADAEIIRASGVVWLDVTLNALKYIDAVNVIHIIGAGGGGSGTVVGTGTAGSIAKWISTIGIGNAAASDIVAAFTSCSGVQYLGADGGCHDANTGFTGLTAGVIPQATSPSTIANSSPVLDNGNTLANTLSYAGTGGINALILSTGTAPVACGSATGCWASTEGATLGTPTASQGYVRLDSTAHAYLISLNNGTEFNSLMNLSSIASSITGLFSGCSGILYLGADGACHSTGAGSGFTGSGTLNTVTKFTGATALGNSSLFDDGTNPTKLPNGTDVVLAGGSYEIANNTTTGTVINKLACDDGAGKAIICPHTTSTTNTPLGIVIAGAGITGNAVLCTIFTCSVISDNTTVAKHWSISSSTVDGDIHDTGALIETLGQPNYFVISANGGAGTVANVRLFTPDSISSGTCANCITIATPGTGVIQTTGTRVATVSTALANGTTATTQAIGDNTTKVASTAFVTSAIAQGNPATAVLAASTANITGTYTAVGAGIGDTFTVTATGAFTLDGIAINTIGQRILLKDQTDATQNGIYTATVIGVSLVSPIFTRALDYDQPSDINYTSAVSVQSGTVNALTSWLLVSQITSIGPAGSNINYSQIGKNPSTTTTTIASGTSTMGTGAITTGVCATVVTTAATGVATTDSIIATPNVDPTGVTGYAPSASGSLYIQAYPTSGNVNFKVCNNTSGSITPSALTLNWRVVR